MSRKKIKGEGILYTDNNHSFVICAYKESPYLEQCIQSLLQQTVKTNVIMITSTPNSYIETLAKKYHIDLYINDQEKGIVNDWNYGYQQANTKYVTLAHQDDVYSKKYVEEVIRSMNREKDTLIAFTDYHEIRENQIVGNTTMLKIKRIMLLPLNLKILQKSIFVRRRILSFGCPICCPSVTYHKEKLPEKIFQVGYRSDEDWQAWEYLSKRKGAFIYCNKPLTYHRIHQESETTSIIGDNIRSQEDYDMYCKFWPKFIARSLVKLYSKSEISNNLSK